MMDLSEEAKQLRASADKDHFHPLTANGPPGSDHFVTFELEGYRLKVTLTRTVISEGFHIYQMSMGCFSCPIHDVPEHIIQSVKQIFLPDGMSFPSVMGNSRQFIEEIE